MYKYNKKCVKVCPKGYIEDTLLMQCIEGEEEIEVPKEDITKCKIKKSSLLQKSISELEVLSNRLVIEYMNSYSLSSQFNVDISSSNEFISFIQR